MNYDPRGSATSFANTETMWKLAVSGLTRGIEQCPNGDDVPSHVAALLGESCESLRSFFPDKPALLGEFLGEHLFKALEAGKIGAGERLIRAGANVHWANQTGATALDVAVKGGRFDTIILLLQSGATEGSQERQQEHKLVSDSQKASILTALVERQQVNSVIHLLSTARFRPADLAEPLMKAIVHANVRMIHALIDAGADVLAKGGPKSLPALDAAMLEDGPIRFNPEVQALVRSLMTEATTARALGGQGAQQRPALAGSQKPGPLESLDAARAIVNAPFEVGSPADAERKPSSPSPL